MNLCVGMNVEQFECVMDEMKDKGFKVRKVFFGCRLLFKFKGMVIDKICVIWIIMYQ